VADKVAQSIEPLCQDVGCGIKPSFNSTAAPWTRARSSGGADHRSKVHGRLGGWTASGGAMTQSESGQAIASWRRGEGQDANGDRDGRTPAPPDRQAAVGWGTRFSRAEKR
jgi:hypothetical protein